MATKVTHTEGPWQQHVENGKVYASVRSSRGQCIADCGPRSDLIAQANAQLIAAAPELLEALEACVRRFDVLDDADEATDTDITVAADARRVIRRARGGQ